MVDPKPPRFTIVRQYGLVSINRSSFYYEGKGETPLNLALTRRTDQQFLETPSYGSRQLARHSRRLGFWVGRTRLSRLMRVMGLAPIYQGPHTSNPHPEHRVYPCLLRGLAIGRANQVWFADVTYIPMRRGFPIWWWSWTGGPARS